MFVYVTFYLFIACKLTILSKSLLSWNEMPITLPYNNTSLFKHLRTLHYHCPIPKTWHIPQDFHNDVISLRTKRPFILLTRHLVAVHQKSVISRLVIPNLQVLLAVKVLHENGNFHRKGALIVCSLFLKVNELKPCLCSGVVTWVREEGHACENMSEHLRRS